MRKLINRPEDFVDEMLQGIYAAHPDKVTYVNNDLRCYVRKHIKPGKAPGDGGGSGHLPPLGYVGEGMLDGCSVYGVFHAQRRTDAGGDQSDRWLRRLVSTGTTGDIMNFDPLPNWRLLKDHRETVSAA